MFPYTRFGQDLDNIRSPVGHGLDTGKGGGRLSPCGGNRLDGNRVPKKVRKLVSMRFPIREAYAECPAVAAKSGQQLLPAMCASCLPLALYGSAALVKVVPPPPAASTLTMLAPPGTAALRKHEANL